MLSLFLQVLIFMAPPSATPSAVEFSMERAVELSLQRNRALVAARLDVDEAEVARMGAGILDNPEIEYSIGNLVLGRGNPQENNLDPSFFEQNIQSVGVNQVLDVWLKRRARVHAACAGIDAARLRLEDAAREVAYAVRSAYADVVREQYEEALARETRQRYDQTIKLSRHRRDAGDIADAEFRKIELEGLKYVNAEYDATLQLRAARSRLAELLAFYDVGDLPMALSFDTLPEVPHADAPDATAIWTTQALSDRADLRAWRAAERAAQLQHTAAERDALPDVTLGVSYTRSLFQASGDNPHVLGGQISLPIPLFDRNQADIAQATIAQRAAQNECISAELTIRREVRDAAEKLTRARAMLRNFDEGAMLQRADTALSVAEKSYGAGAISFLEILEAQRAYIETRAHYLTIRDDYHQAAIELAYVTGKAP